jgi:hypothetical protein
LFPLQTAHQDTQEIAQRGMVIDEAEVRVSMAESAPSHSDTETLNASQPTRPKRPKKLRVEREMGVEPEIEVGAELEPC